MIDDPRISEIAAALRARDGEEALSRTGLMLAEECGEAVQQLRRHLGLARRPASAADVGAELADVAIVVAVLANLLGLDLARGIADKLAEGVR